MNLSIYHNILLNFIIDNKIFVTVFMTIIIVKFKYLSQTNSYLAALAHFIGTFFHELAHYIIAIITTFRIPTKISLFPKIEKINGKRTILLGYVDINKDHLNIFNSFLISMAPLTLLYLAYLVSKYFFTFYIEWFEINIGTYLLYLFLITTLIVNSVPSSAHYIIAIITTFRIPTKISLFPKIEKINGKRTILLGYVDINKDHLNIFNSFLISMAPLTLLYLAYLVSKYFFTFYIEWFEINIGTYLLYLFLITTLIVNSVPSSADFRMARYKGSIYLYILLIIFAHFIYINLGA